MKFALPHFSFEWINLNLFKSLLFVLFSGLASVIVGFTVIINPVLSVVVLAPILLSAFWLLPNTSIKPPTETIRRLFHVWLVLTILWPSYVIFEIPGVFDIWPVRLLMMALVLSGGYFLLKSTIFRAKFIEVYKGHRLIFNLFFGYLLLLFVGTFSKGLFSDAPYMFFRQFSEVFFPLLILLVILSTREKLIKLIDILVVVVAVVVFVGLIESVLEQNVYRIILPDWMISSQDWVQGSLVQKIRGGGYRVQSVFEHPLTMGQFLVLFLPLIIYKFWSATCLRNRVLFFIFSVLVVYLLFLSGSRSVFMGLFVQAFLFGVLLIYFTIKENRASFLGWVITSIFSIVLLVSPVIAYLSKRLVLGRSDNETNSTQARFDMFEKAIGVFKNDPVSLLTGHGAGQAAAVLDYRLPSGFLTIDSYILNVWLGSGLIGLVCFFGFFIAVLHLGVKLITSDDAGRSLVVAIILGICGYLTIATILSQEGNLRLVFLFSFTVVLLSFYQKRQQLN